jgi:hypothetical protein
LARVEWWFLMIGGQSNVPALHKNAIYCFANQSRMVCASHLGRSACTLCPTPATSSTSPEWMRAAN